MVNVKPVKLGRNTRMSFSKINEVMQTPNLIEIQKNSYQWFLDEGLKEVFRDVADITDYSGNLVLSFVGYRMDDTPKYTVKECKERDVTYAAPLRVTARLLNKETGEIKKPGEKVNYSKKRIEEILAVGDFLEEEKKDKEASK